MWMIWKRPRSNYAHSSTSLAPRRADIPGWDSFNYINFIVAAELELGIKFRVADIEAFANVGDIVSETKRLLASVTEATS